MERTIPIRLANNLGAAKDFFVNRLGLELE